MKFDLNWKNKEAHLDADIEKIVEKGLDNRAKKPQKKNAYQIKQEEKRKTEEMRHRHQLQWMMILLGFIVICFIGGIIASVLGV